MPWIMTNAEKLDADLLLRRIDMAKLNMTMSLHTVNFLVKAIPSLEWYRRAISEHFRSGRITIHRMGEGRSTIIHPLATTYHDEGNAEDNRDALRFKMFGWLV